jgi:UDP-N-acetylglucosamine--N-acetylmuramyl-(pentapeptide) pyrophosphoryl-undecaprenol N-acetylglucosamine transferase
MRHTCRNKNNELEDSVNIVLAGGGTAGHIEPALNLADELKSIDPNLNITVLGTSRGLEVDLVPARGYKLELIPAVPLPRKLSGDLVTLPTRLRSAIKQTRDLLHELQADVVVGFGGYVSIPAYLAARGEVPIVVHEANARAGLANRVGARFADAVAETVKDSLPRAQLIGIPLRKAIESLDRSGARSQARDHFGIKSDAICILVFGGSQGSVKLNSVIEDCLNSNVFGDIVVLHSVGLKNEFPKPESESYRPLNYIDRMDLAYAAADFVIGRAGAMTVAELTAVGLPACFVPLPIGNGEQSLNATPVVDAGGAIMISDLEFNSDYVRDQILPIVSNPTKLREMAQRSSSLGHKDSAKDLAKLVLSVAGKAKS